MTCETSGVRKCAVLLLSLEPEQSQEILRRLPADAAGALTEEIARRVSVSLSKRLEREFSEPALSGQPTALALAEEAAEPEVDDAELLSPCDNAPFAFLEPVEERDLADLLTREHPQAAAIILAHLHPQKAAETLAALPMQRQIEVIRRIANLGEILPDVIMELERGMQSEAETLLAKLDDASRRLNEFRGLTSPSFESQDVDVIEDEQEIQQSGDTLVFDDILRFTDEDIRGALAQVDHQQLALSLKTASPRVRRKILDGLDGADAIDVQEQLEHMSAARVLDVEQAQKKILHLLSRNKRPQPGKFDFLDAR